MESLLTEIDAAGNGDEGMSGDILDNRCRMLERLASEVSRLSYFAAKGKVGARNICHHQVTSWRFDALTCLTRPPVSIGLRFRTVSHLKMT